MVSKVSKSYLFCSNINKPNTKKPKQTVTEGMTNGKTYGLNWNGQTAPEYVEADKLLGNFKNYNMEFTDIELALQNIKNTKHELDKTDNNKITLDADYIPGLKETALSDIQQLQEHQSNVYFFSVLGGTALIIFSIIFSRKITASVPSAISPSPVVRQ
jgi:hypothetical protein